MSTPDSLRLELPTEASSLAASLLEWYRREKRALPWRETCDPYPIWVSEVMLQQTRVKAALPYFTRFLETFPRLEDLATAKEEAVLRLWAGLGYYRRARNLLRAAREIVQEHGGEFPRDPKIAVCLPGVGRYTAGAVLSIAYGIPVPVCDGNVKRVMVRYLGIEEEMSSRLETRLWRLLETIVLHPGVSPDIRDFNQSLMELGARVCTPGKPDCTHCPLGWSCRACQMQLQELLPRPTPKRAATHVHLVAAVVRKGDDYLLHRNSRPGLPEGFWEFPMVSGKPGTNLQRRFFEALQLRLRIGHTHSLVKHQITFRKLRLHPVSCELVGAVPSGVQWSWSRLDPPAVPVPSYVSKIRQAAT